MALFEGQPRSTPSVEGLGSVESRDFPISRDAIPKKQCFEHVAESSSAGGADSADETRVQRWIHQARSSVWVPVALRAFGVLCGMLGLAAIGALGTAKGLAGHAVPSATAASSSGVKPEFERASVTPNPPPSRPLAKSSGSPAQAPEPASSAVTADGKVILNLAGAEELMRLPGIGLKRAEAILALRAKLGGRFRRVTDLLRIRGIGPRRLQQMTPLLVLDPPSVPAEGESKRPAERSVPK